MPYPDAVARQATTSECALDADRNKLSSPYLHNAHTYRATSNELENIGQPLNIGFSFLEPAEALVIKPGEPAPWEANSGGPYGINPAKLLVIGNDDPGFIAPTGDPGALPEPYASEATWVIGATKYYCDQRGIPQENIIWDNYGVNTHRQLAAALVAERPYTYWRPWAIDIATRADALQCEGILFGPGMPTMARMTRHEGAGTEGDASIMWLAGLCRYVRDDPDDRDVEGQSTGGTSQWDWWNGSANSYFTPSWDLDMKLTGEIQPNMIHSLSVAVSDAGGGTGSEDWMGISTPVSGARSLLGEDVNQQIPIGRIGMAFWEGDFEGGSIEPTFPHYSGTTNEVEQMVVDIIDGATAAMALTNTQVAQALSDNPIMFHISGGAGEIQGGSANSCLRAAMEDWGFSTMYGYRNPSTAVAQPDSAFYSPIALSDYFHGQGDNDGPFSDEALTQALSLAPPEVIGQVGHNNNDDMWIAAYDDGFDIAATAYHFGHTNANPSQGYRYFLSAQVKGAFSFLGPIYHKGGGLDTPLQMMYMYNLLRGMSSLEAHYYADNIQSKIEGPQGDPLWVPFPVPPAPITFSLGYYFVGMSTVVDGIVFTLNRPIPNSIDWENGWVVARDRSGTVEALMVLSVTKVAPNQLEIDLTGLPLMSGDFALVNWSPQIGLYVNNIEPQEMDPVP